jgi:hypothetical protein
MKIKIEPECMTAIDFGQHVIDDLLGTDWYVVDSLGPEQVYPIALHDIREKYRRQIRRNKWRNAFRAFRHELKK